MRQVPGGPDEWKRMLRAQADNQAEVLVPRPGHPIFELTAPALGPAQVTQFSSFNGEWTSVTLSFGDSGPRATVTTVADDGGMVAVPRQDGAPDAELVRTVESVTVTVATWGITLDAVRIAPVRDMRPLIEASLEARVRLAEARLREARQRPSPPPPGLPPAAGIAAVRALADFTMATTRELRAASAAGRPPGSDLAHGRMHGALWRRAVSERQRLGRVSAERADAEVTSVVNHLGHLVDRAPWFEADGRLREAATGETLRYAMLGEIVPSAPAQRAWSAYWAAHLQGTSRALTHEAIIARMRSRESLLTAWQDAWQAWVTRTR